MECKWNLSQLFESETEFDKSFEKYKEDAKQVLTFKGKLGRAEQVVSYLKLSEKLSIERKRLSAYLFLRQSLNGKDDWANEKSSEFENFCEEFARQKIFVWQELEKNPMKVLESWKKLPEFADYDVWVDDVIKSKKHHIPATQEKLMLGVSAAEASDKLFDVLNDIELKFGKIKNENGKLVKLTHGNYFRYARSQNREIRKQAVSRCNKVYAQFNQTIAVNYVSHLKFAEFYAKTYKYKSTLDHCLEASDLPAKLPQKVVEYVENNLGLLHRYYGWRKRFMHLDKIYRYDLNCDVVPKVDKYFSLEQAFEIIKQALLPLGEEYVHHLDKAVADGWFDTRIMPAKTSGGYCYDVNGVHPFILTSFNETKECVSTLAHEFGHAMHSFYANKAQPLFKADYGIFVAEIASTVNEVLLAKYFIENAKTKQEKISHISNFLTTFVGTVFTQTKFTEFELFVHDRVHKNLPLTYKNMNEFYVNISNKYFGDSVEHAKSDVGWSMIPHFYSDFYVFKYVTGFISACAIAEKLLSDKNYVKQYIKFLSGGCSKKPCELLADAGVDILDKKTFDSAFKLFENYLNILEEESK